jgi:UDP-N-acetylmuramoyl-tripeptide--D-alanyl-D-alanine ligase
MALESSPDGLLVLNDSYNANPDSMRAALSLLSRLERPRKHIAVLGDMYELGQAEVTFHREVGAFAHINGLDVLITVGSLGAHIAAGALAAGMDASAVFACPDASAALKVLDGYLRQQPIVLVKASRGMRLEQLAEEVLARC